MFESIDVAGCEKTVGICIVAEISGTSYKVRKDNAIPVTGHGGP
jgi:hypothetical protein